MSVNQSTQPGMKHSHTFVWTEACIFHPMAILVWAAWIFLKQNPKKMAMASRIRLTLNLRSTHQQMTLKLFFTGRNRKGIFPQTALVGKAWTTFIISGCHHLTSLYAVL